MKKKPVKKNPVEEKEKDLYRKKILGNVYYNMLKNREIPLTEEQWNIKIDSELGLSDEELKKKYPKYDFITIE